MAKRRKAKEQRKRNLYVNALHEWRRGRSRSREPGVAAAPTKKRLFAELHPLSVWPIVGGVEPKDGVVGISIPETFSFIENPAQTLGTLYRLRAAIENQSASEVYFDHSKCKLLDLCASVVTDVLVLRGKRQRHLRGTVLSASGTFSSDVDVNVLLKASGILKHLGVPDAGLPKDVQQRLKLCPLKTGKPSPPEQTSDSELAATELTRFFDSCLSTEKYVLKAEWKGKLISLITEVLDNCEQHANRDHHWYTIGHFNQLEGEAGGECHIVIFNLGDSIYESLKRNDTPESLKRQISDLASTHRSRGFFGLGKAKWEEETLWTLYALQEGVSRFTDAPGGQDRGNGTVRMIKFFTDLAGEHPKMALVSGKTFILFDGKYQLRDKLSEGGEKRKVIAFNERNDLGTPPDEEYVKSLPFKFPGTLVSLRFILHREFLKRVQEVLDERNQDDRSP